MPHPVNTVVSYYSVYAELYVGLTDDNDNNNNADDDDDEEEKAEAEEEDNDNNNDYNNINCEDKNADKYDR